ncbi:MAG: PKD domain-containing protein [Bacteroidota bacterium]
MKRYFLFVVLFLLFNLTGKAQFSNKGTDFWISYPIHVDAANSVMGIYITSDVDAKGTIKVGTQTIDFTVSANNSVQKFIGGTNCASCSASNASVYMDQSIRKGIKTGAGIHVVSDKPVVVYAHIINSARSGASLILPSAVWGRQYIVPSYNNQATNNNQGPFTGYGTVTVIASEANTIVKITPSVRTADGDPAGTPIFVTLANPGDVYQLLFERHADISGTLVESQSSGTGCKSIGVFSSTSWSAFGCGTGVWSGDNLYQQLFPVTAWGKNFLTAPAKTRISDIIRVFVSDPATVVTKTENGVTTTLSVLVKNSFYEYSTGNATYIQADKPVSVAQYFTTQGCQPGATTGDPEMVIMNPVEQTINNITVFSAHRNWVPTNQSRVNNCYLNIIIPSNATSTFKINGNNPISGFIKIQGTNYSYLQEDVTDISLTNPVQTLSADSSFIAIAYGFGDVESYGYNAGTNVKDFSRQATFANPYGRIDSAVTCVNTAFKFAIPLSFQPTTIRWDFSAAPNINPNAVIGPNNNPAADSTPIVNGQTLYYYSPGQTFTFTGANTATIRDTIKLYTTSASVDGCGSNEQIYTIPIKVITKPVADFTWTHTGCVNEPVSFVVPKSSGIRWLWDLGNGSNLDITTDILGAVYNQPGVFNVKLRSISDIGCISDEVTKPISITTKPVASFTYSAIRCMNNDIIFTDASTTQSGTIAKWIWNLDDGAGAVTATSNAAKVMQYASTGTKNITLQVETSTGCKSDVFTPATALFVNPLPQPGFILPEVCLNDASAQFTDTSKIADGSEAQFSYLWNFNAGAPAVAPGPNINSSTLKNPQIKYNKSDNYTVSLRVTSKDGCVNTTAQTFTVNGSVPKADFEVQMNNVLCDKVPIVILNKSMVDFGAVTKSEIYWDRINSPGQFQTDDNPATNKAYPHKYIVNDAAGQNFTIRMVSYSGGNTCVSEVSKTITVHPNPKAAYIISSATVCFDEPIGFTDQSASVSIVAPARWEWNLGKGSISTIQNPVKAYRDSGLFNTSLYVFSAAGCSSDTVSASFTVFPLPVLIMGTKSTAVLEGGELRLKPSFVYGNQLSYLWTPPSYLSSDTAFSPLSKPMSDIRYTFNVIAEGGCTVSDTIFIKVLKSPEIPNAFSPNGDGINDTWNIKYLESYPGATVEVYNRYGQIVYRSLGYSKPWDGRVSGSMLPIGTYYYIINPKNNKPQMTGAITIIR